MVMIAIASILTMFITKYIEIPAASSLTAAARAGEITTILAAAIVRILVSDEPHQSAVRLGFVPDQRVHTTPYQQEKL